MLSILYPTGVTSLGNTVINIPPGEGLTIQGAGSDATILTGSLTLNYGDQFSSAKVSGVTFAATGQGGVGLFLNQPSANGNPALSGQNTIKDVVFRGSDGYQQANYYDQAMRVHNVSNVNWDVCSFIGNNQAHGTGIFIEGSHATNTYGVVYNLDKVTFEGLNKALSIGDFIQGVNLSQCNATACTASIIAEPGSVGVLAQVAVVNSQFGGGRAVDAQGLISGLQFINNQVGFAGNTDAISGALVGFIISNNFFTCGINQNNCAIHCKTNGIGLISGNIIAGPINTGIKLDAPTEQIVVTVDNVISSVTTPINNLSTKNRIMWP